MKKFIAGKNEAGQRFDKYLKKILPNASTGFIYKMLRKRQTATTKKSCTMKHMHHAFRLSQYGR